MPWTSLQQSCLSRPRVDDQARDLEQRQSPFGAVQKRGPPERLPDAARGFVFEIILNTTIDSFTFGAMARHHGENLTRGHVSMRSAPCPKIRPRESQFRT